MNKTYLEIFDIIEKFIVKNWVFFQDYEEEHYRTSISIFLEFIENDDQLNSFNKIINLTKNLNFFNILDRYLDKEEKVILLTLFCCKSFIKQQLDQTNYDENDFSYTNSDSLLNIYFDYINNFLIFFLNKIFDYKILKRESFKYLKTLVAFDVIKEKYIRKGNKTQIYWNFNLNFNNVGKDFILDVSTTPYKTVEIDNNSYLIGNFFTQVYKIFVENIFSKEKFYLKDTSLLLKMKEKYLFIDEDKLYSIIEIVQKNEKKILLNTLDIQNESLKLKQNILKVNSEIIFFLNVKNKEIFYYIKNKLIEVIHIYNFIPKDIMDLDIIFLTLFFDWIEEKNCNFKKTENVDDFINKLNDFFYEDYSKKSSKIGIYFLLDILKIIKKRDLIKIINKFNKKNRLSLFLPKYRSPVEFNLNLSEKENIFYFLKFLNIEDLSKLNKLESQIELNSLKKKKKKIQQDYSKLLEYSKLMMLKYFNEGVKIYFPFFFDFRGRMYFKPLFSPTNFAFSRYVFYYDFYENYELDYLNSKSDIIFKDIYVQFSIQIDKVINHFYIEDTPLFRKTCFWILISMGKIKVKKKEKISIYELIEEGLTYVFEEYESDFTKKNNQNENMDQYEDMGQYEDMVQYEDKDGTEGRYEDEGGSENEDIEQNLKSIINLNNINDEIELTHLISLFKELRKHKIRKLIIQKDATASFLQNLIRLLGYKNEESLKYCNLLSNEFWYDPYSIILNDWIKEENVNEFDKKYFTRKTIKKVIMTYPYSARYITAFDYFKDSIKKEFNKEINFGSLEEKIFKNFYKFISKEMEEKFFLKNNTKIIIEIIKELKDSNKKEFIIESHDSKTNLIYYKTKLKYFDLFIKINQKEFQYVRRETKKYYDIDFNKIDYEKLCLGIRANWIHYIDGTLIRDINYYVDKPYTTIHDAVLVDFLGIEDFLINANKQINKKIFTEYNWNNQNKITFFSIFLFI